MSVGTTTVSPEQFEAVAERIDDINDQIEGLAGRVETAHDHAVADGNRERAEELAGFRHELDDLAELLSDIESAVAMKRQRVLERQHRHTVHDAKVASGNVAADRGVSPMPSYQQAAEDYGSTPSVDDALAELHRALEDR